MSRNGLEDNCPNIVIVKGRESKLPSIAYLLGWDESTDNTQDILHHHCWWEKRGIDNQTGRNGWIEAYGDNHWQKIPWIDIITFHFIKKWIPSTKISVYPMMNIGMGWNWSSV